MGIGDDQLDPGQAAGLERAQERRPERAVLRVADGEAEHLAVAVGGHAGGDDDGLGDHPPVDPGLAVGGIQEHIREGLLGEAAVAEGADLGIEVDADPAHFGLGDAGVGTQRADQVVDLPRAHPVQIGLHHHREQGPVDPPPALQQ